MLGTERHESRRIDNQLRGRSGRQGDPGETRFYLSLEDDLMRLFKADIVDSFLRRFNVPDDVPIEAKMVSNAIRSAQTQVEAQNFEIRKNVLKYDEVMNRQRVVIYEERRRVLEGEDLHEQVRGFLDDTIEGYVVAETADGYAGGLGPRPALDRARHALPGRRHAVDELIEASGGGTRRAHARVPHRGAAGRRAARRTTSARRRSARRSCASSSVASCSRCSTASGASTSTRWTTCRRASACAPWRRRTRSSSTSARATTLFNAMMDSIKEESVGYLFNVEVEVGEQPGVGVDDDEEAAEVEALEALLDAPVTAAPAISAKGLGPQRPTHLEYTAPSVDGEAGVVHASEEVEEAIPELGPDASRAERRRAERAARKRGGGQK